MNSYGQPARIIGIQFGMASSEEIRNGSVCEITTKEISKNDQNEIGGLSDSRMGVLERGQICPTDGLDHMNSPGYHGHIQLAAPIFYKQHLDTIYKTLKCICINCSKLIINKKDHSGILNMYGKDRFTAVHSACTTKQIKTCGEKSLDGCGSILPKIGLDKSTSLIRAEWISNDKTEIQILNAEIVLNIFKKISDDDIVYLGFNLKYSRPESMICEILPIAPPAVRPSVRQDSQQPSQDDLTTMYLRIFKTNQTVYQKIANKDQPELIQDYINTLEHFVNCLIDNTGTGAIISTSGRPLKGIFERLNGKNGRIRSNLQGKRVDFSARSVITANPNISIEWLGVPLAVAKNLTKPITVNQYNIEYLTQLVRNGPDVYPGAKTYERVNKNTMEYVTVDLRHIDRKSIVLEYGMIVNRHIIDGDYVLFNRQPTLHRMSMMGHRVKVMYHGNTFRLNVGVTRPYNADELQPTQKTRKFV